MKWRLDHRLRTTVAWAALLAAATSVAAENAASDGCAAFAWDVSRELATMAKPPLQIEAGRGRGAESARIEIGLHYVVRLAAQSEVKFAITPAKPARDADARAGLLTFRVDQAGRYRIALTTTHWIDVVDGSDLIASRAFQGQRGCDRLHKIVEFELPANRDLVLQLSGSVATDVGIAITSAAPGAN